MTTNKTQSVTDILNAIDTGEESGIHGGIYVDDAGKVYSRVYGAQGSPLPWRGLSIKAVKYLVNNLQEIAASAVEADRMRKDPKAVQAAIDERDLRKRQKAEKEAEAARLAEAAARIKAEGEAAALAVKQVTAQGPPAPSSDVLAALGNLAD